MTFGKFCGTSADQDYTPLTVSDTVSLLTKKIYDTICKYNNGQIIFVVRDKPVNNPAIIQYLKTSNYKYINLADAFDGYNIKNTKINAYYFKASNAYGGHWNNDGHKTMGTFLSNIILENMSTYKMPDYQP